LKFDEQLSRHHLVQQMNYTNSVIRDFLPLSEASNLPSTRNDFGARHLLLGFSDTALLGDQAKPWLLNLRFGYRGEPSDQRPSHPDAGPSTLYNIFDTLTSGGAFWKLGPQQIWKGQTPTKLHPKYTANSVNAGQHISSRQINIRVG